MNKIEFGIEQQRRLDDLVGYRDAYMNNSERMARSMRRQNLNDYRQNVAIAPQPTVPIPQPILAPDMAVRPSNLGMWADIAGTSFGAAKGIIGEIGNMATTA